MANILIATTRISGQADSHKTAIIPNAREGSYATQDTNNNDIKVSGMGKGRLTVAVNNAPNQVLTMDAYGMHSATGAVGDAGTFPIGSQQTIALADKGYVCLNDPFPFYLIRLNHAVAPTDNPAKSVSIFVNISSY